MVVSIVIDLTRSRVLMRTAKKHNSQALEADALHFSTDVWSSAVVIVGLAIVFIGQKIVTGLANLGQLVISCRCDCGTRCFCNCCLRQYQIG